MIRRFRQREGALSILAARFGGRIRLTMALMVGAGTGMAPGRLARRVPLRRVRRLHVVDRRRHLDHLPGHPVGACPAAPQKTACGRSKSRDKARASSGMKFDAQGAGLKLHNL
jgi:hypothetical protein